MTEPQPIPKATVDLIALLLAAAGVLLCLLLFTALMWSYQARWANNDRRRHDERLAGISACARAVDVGACLAKLP